MRVPAEVTVTFVEPERYTDLSLSGSETEPIQNYVMGELEKYLKYLGNSYLPPTHSLDIQVLDVDMAGEYEPWRVPLLTNTRFIRDVYRPRIDLSFVLRDPQGRAVAEQGRKSASDLNDLFKIDSAAYLPNDNLRYEKALLREWFEATFTPPYTDPKSIQDPAP